MNSFLFYAPNTSLKTTKSKRPGRPKSPHTAQVTAFMPIEKPAFMKTELKRKSPTPPKRELRESHITHFKGLTKILKIITAIKAAIMYAAISKGVTSLRPFQNCFF